MILTMKKNFWSRIILFSGNTTKMQVTVMPYVICMPRFVKKMKI